MSCALLSALSPPAAVLRLTEHAVLINSSASLSSVALSRSDFVTSCVSRPGKGIGDVKFGLGDARNKTLSTGSSLDSITSMGTTSSSRNSSKSSAKSDKSSMTPAPMDVSSDHDDFKSIKDSEWKQRLTKEQFDVARKKGTERPFTGEYWKTKTEGTYLCICCNTPLFDSKTKFDSGTGWPSYWATIGDNVKSDTDRSIPFMPRTEVLCRKCDAHLGHVFDDGPRPTGQRFCINSASLKLKPAEK